MRLVPVVREAGVLHVIISNLAAIKLTTHKPYGRQEGH